MSRFAAIDLGSNSFHLLIARVRNGQLTVDRKFSEKIQLGQSVSETGRLCPAAMQRGLKCLGDFRKALRHFPAERIRAVGTQALRAAENREAFVTDASEVLGIPLEVISGMEEARLIYLGLRYSLDKTKRPLLVVDIGGGSTEIALGHKNDLLYRASLPIGCVAFRDRFFPHGRLTPEGYQAAYEHAITHLRDTQPALVIPQKARIYGTSGTIKSIHQILLRQGWTDNGIRPAALEPLRSLLLARERVHRLDLPGLRAHRRSVLTPGVSILEAIMQQLAVRKMRYFPAALREGLIYEMAGHTLRLRAAA